jgi:hypothetical protein
MITRLSRSVHEQSANFRRAAAGTRSWPAVPRGRCTTIDDMDRASKVLAQAPLEVCVTWAAMADWGGVSTLTLYKRAHGQPLIEDKGQG